MGNGAVGHDGSVEEVLDSTVDGNIQRKPAQVSDSNIGVDPLGSEVGRPKESPRPLPVIVPSNEEVKNKDSPPSDPPPKVKKQPSGPPPKAIAEKVPEEDKNLLDMAFAPSQSADEGDNKPKSPEISPVQKPSKMDPPVEPPPSKLVEVARNLSPLPSNESETEAAPIPVKESSPEIVPDVTVEDEDTAAEQLDSTAPPTTVSSSSAKTKGGSGGHNHKHVRESSNSDMASRTSKGTHGKKDKKGGSVPDKKAAAPVVVDEDDFEHDGNVSDVSGSEEDLEPVEVLQQYIPYYGQGDPANDSIVRSALSGLSVEDIDSKDEYGNTLLLLACQYRCEDLVRIMLNKGADPNAVNSSGACCLHFACYRDSCSYAIAKILLQNGANPDIAETSYGCTPLHYCAGNGDLNFCKLMLSYGAQVATFDYYNYTCVDYAREGGFTDVINFLSGRLEKANARGGGGGGLGGFGSSNNMMSPGLNRTGSSMSMKAAMTASSYEDISQWEVHVDPESGGKYYIHGKTGECLWESELKARMTQYQQAQQQQMKATSPLSTKMSPSTKTPFNNNSSSNNNGNSASVAEAEAQAQAQAQQQQLVKTQLVAIIAKYEPAKLLQVDNMLNEHQGKEEDLLKKLAADYKIQQDPEFSAMLVKLKESNQPKKTPASVGSFTSEMMASIKAGTADPMVLHELAQETRKKLEAQFEEERVLIKKKHDAQLEDEKSTYRQAISEKEGALVKLQGVVESLEREKATLQHDVGELKAKIVVLQSDGGAALQGAEAELAKLQEENGKLHQQISSLQQELQIERDKLKSLESTLMNLTSGQEELVAREQKAAGERAEQQRLREEAHARTLQEQEERAKNAMMKVKSELNQARNEFIRNERDLKDQLDTLKVTKEREIESLRRELADQKAQFAQEMSAAQMKMADMQRLTEELTHRAEEAENYQRMVVEEIAEAKVVQKYNAQLHKDLQREQLARKKLHNEMEDMKGKIRVYVRIRPFSNSERERGSTEAVTKDGKMSVLVKGVGGPENKKVFDFDQVFGGTESNSQTDIFKDTKHLIMSVVDGYNVCIFAYGQTGAGKSYTMIGAADIATCINAQGDFDDQAGITPRAVAELFRLLNERTAQVEFTVEVQMFQLYRDGLEDLLKEKKTNKKGNKKGDDEDEKKDAPLKITLAEHSPTGLVYVEGAEMMTATTPVDVMRIFAKGSARRTTASTQMNAESSRSHLICSLVVRLKNRRSGQQSIGKLTLVDLAGSERVDKSGATGEQLKEAQSINKSLSALGDVIAALTTNQNHVPYRNHPLTMLMSDSIGGNAKTLMFVNTSPADYNCQESNNSLAFASRCKDITNMVSGGPPGVQAAQVSALKKELAKLKKGAGGGGGPGGGGKNGGPNASAGGNGGPGLGATMNLARPDTAQQGRPARG